MLELSLLGKRVFQIPKLRLPNSDAPQMHLHLHNLISANLIGASACCFCWDVTLKQLAPSLHTQQT